MKKFQGLSILLCIFSLLSPAHAQGEALVLTENGIELSIALPPGCAESSRIRPHHAIYYIGSTQVVLAIEDTSVKKRLALEESVYENLKKDHPGLTSLEELPDITADIGVFTVRKLIYNDHNDRQAATLTAFCKLNYRYIYTITLRDIGNVNYELLKLFTSATTEQTPLNLPPEILLFAGLWTLVGLCYILSDIRKKHFWPRTTGVVTDCIPHRKYAAVLISYRAANGNTITGGHNMMFGMLYARKKGRKVEISYSEKDPRHIHVLSYKERYILGLIFLCLAALYVYLIIFEL